MSHGNKKTGWLLASSKDGVTFLRKFRLERGLTAQDAARMAGLSTGHYSNIEGAQRSLTELVYPRLEKFLTDLGVDKLTRDIILR